MKKIAAILLVLIYSMSTFGVSLKEFYCCGKLKSVSITFADTRKGKCNEAAKEEGCCKTKYQYFKVKDNHLTTTHATAPLKYYTDLYFSAASFQSISFTHVTGETNLSHAPPLHQAVPVYIAKCVFRI